MAWHGQRATVVAVSSAAGPGATFRWTLARPTATGTTPTIETTPRASASQGLLHLESQRSPPEGAFGRADRHLVESVVDAVSSEGKDKLGSISKQGDRYLRSLFTTGALAVIRYAKIHGTRHRPSLAGL